MEHMLDGIWLLAEHRRAMPHRDAALAARLRKLRDSINAALDPHERLQLLAVTREEWTIAAGLLTPTMKIKRHAIRATHGDKIDSLYV